MNSTQYTIRAIPTKVDKALRDQSKRSGKSLNSVVVDYLTAASGAVDSGVSEHDDLDWFFRSSKNTDKKLTGEMDDWLDSAPKELN